LRIGNGTRKIIIERWFELCQENADTIVEFSQLPNQYHFARMVDREILQITMDNGKVFEFGRQRRMITDEEKGLKGSYSIPPAMEDSERHVEMFEKYRNTNWVVDGDEELLQSRTPPIKSRKIADGEFMDSRRASAYMEPNVVRFS
jgi:hypothetical protein